MRVLAVDGSPTGAGRTAAVLDAVLAGAAESGAQPELVSLADDGGVAAALAAAEGADAFVFGSPVYRGTYSGTLKSFLDELPRGMWGEKTAPATGRAAAIVCTGATWHHYLALDDLRSVLGGFFAAQVLSPGLYVPGEGFSDGSLVQDFDRQARQTGVTLVELARAIAGSEALQAIRPQA